MPIHLDRRGERTAENHAGYDALLVEQAVGALRGWSKKGAGSGP